MGRKATIVCIKRRIHGTRNILPQIIKFMKLEYLHDNFTSLTKSEVIVGKIKQTVLLHEEITAFNDIGIKLKPTEPVVTFRILQRVNDKLHAYKQKSVKNGSICEIQPGKKFVCIKCFCKIRNSTYALCNLFTIKEDVFYDTSTNDITDLHLADAITHRFFYLVEKLQQNNVIVVNTKSLFKKCIFLPMRNVDFDIIVPLANVLENH